MDTWFQIPVNGENDPSSEEYKEEEKEYWHRQNNYDE